MNAEAAIKEEAMLKVEQVKTWIMNYDHDSKLNWHAAQANGTKEISFYQNIVLPLLSITLTGSVTVERVAKPLKNNVLTVLRSQMKDHKAELLLRLGLNLRFLMRYEKEKMN